MPSGQDHESRLAGADMVDNVWLADANAIPESEGLDRKRRGDPYICRPDENGYAMCTCSVIPNKSPLLQATCLGGAFPPVELRKADGLKIHDM